MARQQAFLESVFRSNRSNPKKIQSARKKPQRNLAFEPLEPRVLLSNDTMVFVVDALHNDLTLRIDDGVAKIIDSSTGSLLLSGALENTSAVTIQGSEGDDSLRIDSSVASAGLAVSFEGSAGDDALYGSGVDSTWNITGDGAGSVGHIAFAELEDLIGADFNLDTFIFGQDGNLFGSLEGGAGGFDTIELNGSFNEIAYTISGPESGTIQRDGSVLTYSGFEPIIDNTVGGARVVNATAGNDKILVVNRAEHLDQQFAVSIDTGEDVIFNDAGSITSLTINAGGGDDKIDVQLMSDLTVGSTMTINAGDDNDEITLQALDDDVTYVVNGDGGFDTFIAPTQGDATVTNALISDASGSPNDIQIADIERVAIFASGGSVDASGFTGQAFIWTGSAIWGEEGPTPFTQILDSATAPWDPVSGAINAVVVDPNDRFTMYVGTVNGGVWKNTGGTEVFFGTSESTLTGDDHTILNAFANFLEQNPRLTVEIGGHTDSSGTPADNLTLSLARAQSVRDYLVNTRRIDATRLTVVGYGEDRPVAANPLNGDQLLNRRTELRIQNWIPLTDGFPSLSVSTVAISPLSSNVIYAGIGRTSSFGFEGGLQTGLLFSNDGGANWQVMAADELKGLTVTKVLPTTLTEPGGEQVVFVSTFDVDRNKDTNLDDTGGVFRLKVNTTTGAVVVEKISSANGVLTGLPGGHYTDLAFDPVNSVVYAANPSRGVFRFTDGTDGMWHLENTGFQFGTDTDANTVDDLLQNARRIKLAIHETTGTLYAAVIGPVNATGQFNLTATGLGLIQLFKTENFGANWNPMPSLPGSVDNGTLFGLNAGQQGDRHFSIVVDPTNKDTIYVGGDAQGSTTNAAGLTNAGSGRIFMFSGGAWTQIVGINADNTAPHADSRGMVFASPYTLFEISDGGLTRLQNPRGEADQGTRRWTSANDGLRISEILGLAFDPLNQDIIVGTQDNGSAHQGAGSTDGINNDHDGVDTNGDGVVGFNEGTIDEADESFFWSGTGGDGNSQATISIDTNGDAVLDRVLRYSGHNNFNFFQVYEYTTAGVLVNAAGVPTNTFTTIGFRQPGNAAALSGLNAQDVALGFDFIPMVVNSNDPTRMVIAHSGIYESVNTNINPGPGVARILPLDEVQQVDPAAGVVVAGGNEVTALIYGGVTGGVANNDLIIAARANRVQVRQAAGGAFTSHTVNGAGTIRALAVDPDDWKVVYAADSTDVYRTSDITAGVVVWVKITGNLKAIGQQGLRDLEYVEAATGDLLLVGGQGGVSRLRNPDAPIANLEAWVRFGTGLPNAPVFDIEFLDLVGPGALNGGDRLIAGTLGRGVWSISGPQIHSLGDTSVLTILGHDTDADNFKFIRDTENPLLFNVFDLTSLDPDPAFTARGAIFDQIQVNTRGGDDTVTVDYSAGAVSVPRGIAYDGGADPDTLVLTGGAFTSYSTGTTGGGLTFHDIVDLSGRTQRVLVENVTNEDTTALPSPLDNAFATVKGALDTLVEFMTFVDNLSNNISFLGTSLGRALNGVPVDGAPPVANPLGKVVTPQSTSVVADSGNAVNLLRRFIETGTGAFDIDEIANFTTLTELENALEALDESGTGSVSSTGDLTTGFEITLTGIKKKLSGRADVTLDVMGGAINIEGFVDVSADVTLNLTFGVDNLLGFYIKENGAIDEIVVDHVVIANTNDIKARGRFGFLGVEMSQAELTVHPNVRFEINIDETGGDGNILLVDLVSTPSDYVSANLETAAAATDVTLTGTFQVSAIIPGLTPFSLLDARATITWAEITDPTNAVVTPAAGAGAVALFRFLEVGTQDFLDQLTELKDNINDLFGGVEIPFLSDGLTELVGFVTAFQDKVLDPISDGLGGFGIPTIQSLVTTLADKLGIALANFGLSYNSTTTELTFHLLVEETIVNETKSLGAGIDLADSLADVQFNTDATVGATVVLDVIFGVDLQKLVSGVGTPLDWFFLKNPSLALNATITAEDVEAKARFGFLSIGIDEGELEATDLSLTVTLNDPGANDPVGNPNGRIDLSEIDDGLADPLDFIDITGGGSIHVTLPVEVSFGGILGLGDIPDGTPLNTLLERSVIIDVPDLTAPTIFTIEVGDQLTHVGNFTNIDAASLVSLLGQLTFWLDEFRRSDEFADFDLPIVGPALDQVLTFADAFRDTLLIDDQDNGTDDSKTLLNDLNAALEDAGLGRLLYFTRTGNNLVLTGLDASVTAFTIAGATPLGFAASQPGSVPGGEFFAKAIAMNSFSDAEGNLGGDLSFTVTIGTKVYTVEVDQAVTTANTSIGDDRWKLVNGQNAATFATVQEMALRLLDAFSPFDPGLAYSDATQAITFTIDLSGVFGQLDLPFGFSFEELDDFLKIQTSGKLRLTASGNLHIQLGVFLGAAEPSDKLQLGPAPTPTLLADLTEPVEISTEPRYTAPNPVRTVYGQLSGDASFTLTIQGDAAFLNPLTVTVLQADTITNVTAQDLADDINDSLEGLNVDGSIEAFADGLRIELRKKAGATLTGFSLAASGTNPAVKDIGFGTVGTAEVDPDDSKLKITATKDLVALRGRLTGDASFMVSLDNVNAGAPFLITVLAASTATNRFAFDIVNDINANFSLVDDEEWFYDSDPTSGVLMVPRIEVSFSDGKLTFEGKDGATSLTVSAVNGIAASELGLSNDSGNSRDLIITLRSGAVKFVTLDGAVTIADVKTKIESDTNSLVEVTINQRGSGLNLRDLSTGPFVSEFKVQIANNSTAGLQLGIVGEDAAEGEDTDGIIEGADIAALTPLDRFFITATPGPGAPLAGLSVKLSTPTPLTASAQFGFVGLELTGDGTLGPDHDALVASLTLRLNQPAGSTDGRISLAELIDSLDNILSLFDISLTGNASFDLSINAPQIAELASGLGIDLGADPKIHVDATLGDVFADTPVAPTFNITYPNFGELLDFGNVEFNFQTIIAGLRLLNDFLGQFEQFDFLDEPMPVVGISVSELIDVADKFADAIDDARNNPAGTVQVLEDKLKQAFGLPLASNLIDLVLVNDDNDTGDTADDFKILRFDLNVGAAFSESVGIDFDLGSFLDVPIPLDLGGGADLTAAGSANLKVSIGIDIADPTRLFLFNDTGLEATLDLTGSDVTFHAAAGPLGVFVDQGSVEIGGTLVPGDKLFRADFDALTFVNNRFEIDFDDLEALFEGFSAELAGEIDVTLPVYFPTESIFAGTVLFQAALSLDSEGNFEFDVNPHATDENGDPIGLEQLFAFDPAELSLLDQLILGVDGVDLFLEGLQDILSGEIGGIELPLIGDDLAGAADVIGDFRTGFVEDFRKGIEDMANPAAEFAASGAGGGAGLLAVPADPVSKILFELLGAPGLDLLLDTNGNHISDIGDITFKTNFNESGIDPSELFFDWDFKLGQTLDKSAGIGFDIGIPGLGLETTGEVQLILGWELALGFGLNFDDGFYFDIGNDADEEGDDNTELMLFVDVSIPGGGITGKLGFLQLSAEDDTDDDDDLTTHLSAMFGINIFNKSNSTDTKLGFSELGRISIEAGIAAEAVVDLGMTLSLSSDLMPSAPTNFPSIVADFSLIWQLGDVDNLVGLDELDGSFLKNGLQIVKFENVGLDLGSYLSELIGPIANTIAEITEPIKPFLDFLTEPIPVISQLAGPTSLLDIASMSGLINPGIILAIEVIDQVIDIAHMVSSLPDGNVIMYFDEYLPSLIIYEAPPAGFAALAAGEGIDLTNPNLDLKSLKNELLAGLDFLPDEIQDALDGVLTDVADGVSKMLPGGSASSGFSLPIIEDPSQIFGMLMGQPAVLVQYNMAPLILEAEFSAFFSIFGPLGVSINAEFGAQFGPFTFGYDTLGITSFAASDFKNPLLLFDGFFVGDLDEEGNDVPELQFDAALWAAAELNLGIARGGVGGGLFAEIDFDLHDPNKDGRVRIAEIVTNILNEFNYGEKLLSPLAMFDITGKLTAELFAFLKIDFGFFEVDEKFLITEPITLLDFESNFERFPTLATELPDGVLQLNMGKFSEQRVEGDLTDSAEVFHVKQDGVGKVLVWAPSLGVDVGEAQSYEVTKLILALGGEGNDTIDLSLVTDNNLKFELEGNEGDDTIIAGSGTGAAHILGGAGDDTLTGGGGDDTIFGETGDDTIDGMGGKDWLFGDGDAEDSILGNTITVTVKANDGNDNIGGGGDDDLIFGAGGLDTITGGDGADVLIGDGGTVTVGNDRLVVTKRSLLIPQQADANRLELAVSDTSVTGKGANDDIDGEGGNDRIYGGVGNDLLEGGDNDDVIWGEAGEDTINAGDGNDIAFGDFGTFVIFNAVLEPEITVGGENDLIHGDGGNDKLLGGAGKDTMFGDAGADNMWGGTGQDTMSGGLGADFLFGNADSDDLQGGDEGDFLEGGGGNDLMRGGAGGDLLVGGYGSDDMDGEEGADTYKISARGGAVTELTIAYDSGTVPTETDTLILVGTDEADTVLLRAMADFYFPTEVKLVGNNNTKGLTDKIFESGEPDKLRSILQALEDAYGPHAIPDGLISEIIELFVADVQAGVLDAIDDHYVADPDPESTVPTKESLIELLTDPDDPDDPDNPDDDEDYIGILLTGSRSKLQEIQDAITEAYGENAVPSTMFDAIINAWNTFGNQLKGDIEQAIKDVYEDEETVLGADTDTGFIVLINNGGANVERFNYRDMEGLVVNTVGGNDYVVSDDVIGPTTINLGIGEDKVQIGQVFRSERVKDFDGELITGITAEDVFTTLEITRGWLSNGISRATTVNGGEGNDQFTVFHNIAVLNLNGGDGDDIFTVRAFALKGSTDSERARTDMKGDGGADTILYVVNAPVGIDGGDGFDTVRIVGTEFADDFVVTDSGIFGAGLNVTYVNIEKLVADGAEGDDRYFVLSTGLEVVTEIDGGLGSDTFFVGGNPSRAPIPVISNDFKGHSGIILHNVESTLDGSAWDGLPVEGISANIGDNEEAFFIVTESGGSSRVVEGSTNNLPGWEFDSYGIRLTSAPGAGQTVTINIVLAGMSPEDQARGFRDLEFYAVDGGDTLDGEPQGDPLGFNELTDLPNLPSLTFTEANWFQNQYIKFRAVDEANYDPDTVQPLDSPLVDEASEGRRFVFINHSAQNSTDPDYQSAQMLSVKVQMEDDDRDYVIVTPSERGNVILEGGFTDDFSVVLSQAPSHPVTVTMTVLDGQFTLNHTVLTFDNDDDADDSDGTLWSLPQTVTVTATNDSVVEGFDTDYIQFVVESEDVDRTEEVINLEVDGDFDILGYQPIPPAKPTSYVLLPHRPLLDQPISVSINDVPRAAGSFTVSGNTLSFVGAGGVSQLVVGTVKVSYKYHEEGYDESFVKDSVVDIYDNDTPTVIVEQLGNGSTDVIEGDGLFGFDTYRIRLSQAPAAGETVTVNVDAVDTRTTYARTVHFVTQLNVLTLPLDSDGDPTLTHITFDDSNWDDWQTVFVFAIDDDFLDGNDTQVFAPDLQTVNKIRGPLIIEGAAGAGSLSLPKPLMLPNELNILAPDGVVQAFVPGTGGGADETMTVLLADLLDVIDRLQLEDSTITSVQDLVGKTVEMSKGPGTDIILDPLRPDDRYDRFWLIKEVVELGGGLVELTLQNPTLVDPGQPNVTAPDSTSEYAVTSLSVNFFADEREQIDYLFVFDNDSVADDVGALTSSDGHVLTFNANVMTVDTAALQAVAKLIDPDAATVDLNVLVGLTLEITVGPGLGRGWTIYSITDLNPPEPGLKLVTLTPIAGPVVENPTNRSEFRIAGSDRYGRLIGFGMGPNVLFSTRPQPGGITYGDIEVVQIQLGRGNDTVRVDYTTNSEDHTTKRSGDFYTLTALDTGAGNDVVTVELDAVEDGAFALNLEAGNDTVLGGESTLPLVVFGGLGADLITTGAGDDIVFGDIGRVDYIKTVNTDTDNDGEADTLVDQIITRLGHTVAQNPVNPPVSSATTTSLTDNNTTFDTEKGGLVGLSVQAISPQGHVQFRTIVDNDEHTLTIDQPWDSIPTSSYFYRFSSRPEDQTDGLVRGPRLIWSIDDENGGNDTLNAGFGVDIVIGGAENDTIDSGGDADYVAGDDARFDFVPVEGNDGPTQLLSISDPGTVGNDVLTGGDDPDLLIGGLGDDLITGGGNNDVLIGDDADVTFGDDGVTIISIVTTNRLQGGTDTIYGGGQDDILIGGTTADRLDGGADEDLIFGDNVQLTRVLNSGNAIDPRFRAPAGSIYTAAGGVQVGSELAAGIDPVPGGGPAWADFTITLDQLLDPLQFGNDYIAGGAGDDEIFGQLGDDVIQGDGAITLTVSAARVAGLLVVQASTEDLAGVNTDGDDYIEGNGGLDVIFGNLGQDDIIGGSSSLFSLITPVLRPDGADLIFGGAGTDGSRSNPGDASATGHSRDADSILGDNGNIYRLVVADGSAYRTFNYDNYNNGTGPLNKIVPRAEELLDYTPGGPDFTSVVEAGEVALGNIGAADEIHGESGDDFIYGMVGGDVLFGDAQNDVVIGGYGADWISGGTGDDGILGDDGRLLISRNPLAEPLYGILAIPTNLRNVEINANSGVYNGIINVTGALKYTADLTPSNLDPAVSQSLFFRPLYANDVIYGGWGTDSIHSGAGDDAILGGEAPVVGFTNNYDQAGAQLNLALIASDFDHPVNPGNVLGYNPTTTKFALYDANDPLRKILLTNTGALSKTGSGSEWLLNFVSTPGEGPNDTFWRNGPYPGLATDGDDHIFADLGNDWLVGGTGRDTMWAGWGDDLLNADDVLLTFQTSDTNPSYEDLAFGGGGRDVMYVNTNGDRAVDWLGEYNTYYTPFSQFGAVAVNRLLLPQLPDYLYALSESQGADQTLGANNAADPRNNEPFGEIALVLQQDAQWQAQTGSPRDPQPGNTGGSQVDLKNKPGTTNNKPLYFTAEAPATSLEAPVLLTDEQLATVTSAAKEFWALELGAGDSRLGTLDSVKIEVGNLLDLSLGATIGNWILIDSDAAGFGWNLDSLNGQMDLLTVVKHELGHLLGFDHDDDGLMGETLAAGSTTSSDSRSSMFDYLQAAAGSRSSVATSLIDWTRDSDSRKLSWGPLNGKGNRVGFPEFSIDGSQKKRRADSTEDVAAEVLTDWRVEV